MTKKSDFPLITGILIFSIGTISAIYNVSAVVANFFLISQGIILRVKDLFFDLVLILLGLMLIRKKKNHNTISIRKLNH